jgi:hypothetical protein
LTKQSPFDIIISSRKERIKKMKKELYVLYLPCSEPRFLNLTKGEANLVEEILDLVSVEVEFEKVANFDIFEVMGD